MALYNNLTQNSVISAVEFSPVPDGNFTFVYADPAKKDDIKNWLTSKDVGQEIVAESQVNGKTVFITQGDKSKADMIQLFKGRGDELQLFKKDKKFNAWKMRGIMSMIGQPLQILSGYMQKGAVDGATVTFGVTNMTANLVNIFFGGEKSKDVHRLRFLKQEVNDMLGEHIQPGDTLLSVDDKRAPLRHGPEAPLTVGQKIHGFIQRYSVTGGEIGLRYLGSIALAFPISKELKKLPPNVVEKLPAEVQALEKTARHWGVGMKQLFTGSFKEAYKTLGNSDRPTHWAGVTYMAGKTLAFTSKTPDPYDPKPKSTLDTIREKYTFPVSSWIELGAASMIAYDRFANEKRKINMPKWRVIPDKLKGKPVQDYLGGVGATMFMGGFIIRLFAPFGSKELNMDELNAHITDTLAKTPPEKVPQLMADVASTVKEQLKDKPLEYGEIYTKMVTDLYRYHHITTQANSNKPLATPNEASVDAATLPQEKQADKIASRRPQDRVNTPTTSYAADVARTASESPTLSV